MIVNAIKDVLLRFNLQLKNCRGQAYDSASNMLGKNSDVATKITAEQPKAFVVNRYSHSFKFDGKTTHLFVRSNR